MTNINTLNMTACITHMWHVLLKTSETTDGVD